jgi:hypothetical protein
MTLQGPMAAIKSGCERINFAATTKEPRGSRVPNEFE